MSKSITLKASEIRRGHFFRRPGQRKWRQASTVYDLEVSAATPVASMLVCEPSCHQNVIPKDELVEIRLFEDPEAGHVAKSSQRRRVRS